jgi:hypothetical protein
MKNKMKIINKISGFLIILAALLIITSPKTVFSQSTYTYIDANGHEVILTQNPGYNTYGYGAHGYTRKGYYTSGYNNEPNGYYQIGGDDSHMYYNPYYNQNEQQNNGYRYTRTGYRKVYRHRR